MQETSHLGLETSVCVVTTFVSSQPSTIRFFPFCISTFQCSDTVALRIRSNAPILSHSEYSFYGCPIDFSKITTFSCGYSCLYYFFSTKWNHLLVNLFHHYDHVCYSFAPESMFDGGIPAPPPSRGAAPRYPA